MYISSWWLQLLVFCWSTIFGMIASANDERSFSDRMPPKIYNNRHLHIYVCIYIYIYIVCMYICMYI